MESNINKEASKLLQISDELSVSDLELPEIVQKKRKVRRKTRARSSGTTPTKKHLCTFGAAGQCSNIIMWISILLTSCWLATLSYMISAIHAENLQLGFELKKVSVTSQNLPDALQKWHETSAYLGKNQTVIYVKIRELQKTIESLRSNFTEYKTTLNANKDYAKDKKVVADFGAKIEAVATDIEGIKDHFNSVVNNQNNMKNELQIIQSNLSEVTNMGSGVYAPTNYSNEMESLKSSLLGQIQIVAGNLSIINDTLSQKSEMINDELLGHKTKLDDLLDRSAKISSHVTSIEDSWTKYRQKLLDFEIITSAMNNTILDLKNKSVAIEESVRNICTNCNSFYTQAIQNYYKHVELHNQTMHSTEDKLRSEANDWGFSKLSKENTSRTKFAEKKSVKSDQNLKEVVSPN